MPEAGQYIASGWSTEESDVPTKREVLGLLHTLSLQGSVDVARLARVRRKRIWVHSVSLKALQSSSLLIGGTFFGMCRIGLLRLRRWHWCCWRRCRLRSENILPLLTEPPSLLPVTWLIDTALPGGTIYNSREQYTETLEVNGLEDPAVEPGVNVCLPLFFF